MSRLIQPVLLALLLGAAACSQPTATPGEGDAGLPPSDLVGRGCNVDAECGALRCDTVRRQCICLSDESCAAGDGGAPRYCNNYTGMCVEEISGCTSDAQCPTAEFCDASIRACRPVKGFCESCTRDGECGGAGDDCVALPGAERACGRACAADGDCPRGAVCAASGAGRQCAPAGAGRSAGTCADFRGCTPDSRATCAADADCGGAGDQRCDTGTGRCVVRQQVCPAGTVCDARDRVCVSDCGADADCEPGFRCVDRACEPESACASDAQCPQGKVCLLAPGTTEGECRAQCRVDAECPVGTLCAVQADGRSRCQSGCTTHAGCSLDQRCNSTTRQCEGPSAGGVQVCQATSACGTCQLCSPLQQCVSASAAFPYCQPCSGNTDCPGGVCLQLSDGMTCARPCGAGQECPSGFVCLGYGGVQADGGVDSACVRPDRLCAGKCP